MNAIVMAILTMSVSAIGAFITALTGWFRWSATRISQRRVSPPPGLARGRRPSRGSPPLSVSPQRSVSLKITSSDGREVELVVDRNASDAKVGKVIARALRRAPEKDSDAPKDDNRASGAGGTVSD